MPESSADYARQMSGLASQYMTNYDPNAATTIQQTINDAVGNYAPEYGEINRMESALPTAIGASLNTDLPAFYGKAGFTPDALNRIQTALGNVGTSMGNLNYARNLLTAKQGRMDTLSNNALQGYLGGIQAGMNQYNMLTPLYQGALSSENNAAQREWQGGQNALDRSATIQSNSLPSLADVLAGFNAPATNQNAAWVPINVVDPQESQTGVSGQYAFDVPSYNGAPVTRTQIPYMPGTKFAPIF